MEHDANVAAKKKAKQLAHKASKRFEDVVWPALLQLEVSTRAQQHVAMALTSEFEARQAALGDPPSPPSGARLGSAPYLHGASVPHGVDTGPVRVDGSSSVAKSTGAGAGADGGARALPYGSSGSVASGTTYSAVESYHDERTVGGQTANGGAPDAHEAAELKVRARVTLYCVKGGHARVLHDARSLLPLLAGSRVTRMCGALQTRVFNMYMKPAHGGPPDLLRVVQFLKEAQQVRAVRNVAYIRILGYERHTQPSVHP